MRPSLGAIVLPTPAEYVPNTQRVQRGGGWGWPEAAEVAEGTWFKRVQIKPQVTHSERSVEES